MYLFDSSFQTTYDGDVSPWVFVAILCCSLVFVLILYCIRAYAQYKIAQKLRDESPAWAWIPILSEIQKFRMAGMRAWYTVLIFVPLGNIAFVVLATIACYKIIIKLGLPGWQIILMVLLAPFYYMYIALTIDGDPLPIRMSPK